MFAIDVRFEKTHPDALIADIQNAYLSGMSLSEAEEQFDDFFPCVEAAICLAIDKGWNIDTAIAKNLEYMYDYFYGGDMSDEGLCRGIVDEAMEYIHTTQIQNA